MKICTPEYEIHFDKNSYNLLQKFIEEKKYSKIFILTDENTYEFCLPKFLSLFPFEVEIIEIEAGEPNKNIETCVGVWETLSDLQANRKSLLINLGGGMVTDLGGFVASTYMRGIDFINIPTSLLAMVDASVGGKTGVDLGILKNQIGVINTPKKVIIDADYLETLPPRELRSGLAEMFKHGLISSENYWKKLTTLQQKTTDDLLQLIYESVQIKNEIVREDPTEKGLRKILNFGHTLGHAIESFSLTQKTEKQLLHGEAIAIGMILESYISYKEMNFLFQKCDEIKQVLQHYFPVKNFSEEDIREIFSLLKHDKKNTSEQINFVLLKNIGSPVIDCPTDFNTIKEAFSYYIS